MTNFDTARDALETSLNSSGSAMREHEKWQQSLEAQILKLKASWQSLSQAFLSSDFLHGALEAVIGLVDGLTQLIDTFGAFPTIMTSIAAGMSIFKNTGFIKTFNSDLDTFTSKIGIANKSFVELGKAFKSNGIKGFFNALKSPLSEADLAAIDRYNTLIKQGVNGNDAYNQSMKNSSVAAQSLVKAANGSAVAIGKQATATLGARVAMIGARAAAVALNAALTMGISLLIDFVVSGISSVFNEEEELAEEVEELTTKFREQSEELKKLKGDYDTSSDSSMISRYKKLSKGVGNLGENILLTTDEYSEYQSIVNKIAEQFPNLITGYDSQGNAILSCKDDVEQLTVAYEELLHKQNEVILKNSGKIQNNFENKQEQYNGYGFWESIGNFFSWDGVFGGKMDDYDMKKDTAEWLAGLTSDTSQKEIEDYLSWSPLKENEIRQFLQNAGYDINRYSSDSTVAKTIKDIIGKQPKTWKALLDENYAQFDENVEQYKENATALLQDAFDVRQSISKLKFDYGNISEDLQAVAYQTVNSFDSKFLSKLSDEGKTVEQWITEMLNQLNSIDKDKSAEIEAAFDLQTKFNNDEISYGEYVEGLEDTGKLIERLNLKPEFESQLKLSLGLDEDGTVKEYENLKKRLASEEYFDIMPNEYESFLKGLSSEEISVLWDVIPELEGTKYKESIADIKAALEKEMMLQGLTFDLNIEVEQTGIEALNTALAESVSSSGLSSESISALKGRYAELESQGYDLSAMFEETSHGIHLNRREFNKLEKAYATEKLQKIDGELTEMKDAYDDLGDAIRKTDDPVKKAELYNDRQTLAKRISEAATLAAQYEGLTSAYNDWLAAQEAGQERDMYENVIEGLETIDDEISRGWYDDSTIEFLELLTGKDLSSAGIDGIKSAYKELGKTIKYVNNEGKVLEDTGYSVRDFFTVDEDGNSTSDGVYNFLDAIGRLEEEAFGGKDVIKRNKNGKIISFDFELAGGDEAIADALGISEELVQIMKRAADDAGFVVTLDGSYKQLADLENEAKAAANYLKEIGKTDFNFDFNTSSVESLNQQLDKAKEILEDKKFWNKDGTFNFDAKGATEAMTVVSTLQAKLDKLTEDKYGIGLTVEDEKFEEPLEKLQDYGHTVQTLNQLKLNPETNAKEIKELEGDLDTIAQDLIDLSKNGNLDIGIDADDNIDDVKKKIEKGEIKIPTVLDIQANMDKNIETLADLALLNSGLLSEDEEEVIKKKYKIEAEVDDSDVNEEGWSGLADFKESREASIKIIAETFGVEDVDDLSEKLKGVDDKTIAAVAEVFGQADVDLLKMTFALLEPKTVEAIAKTMGEGDVEGLKTAILNIPNKVHAQAIAEAFGYEDVSDLCGAIDNLSPKTVQAIAEALGITDVDSLKGAIDSLDNKDVKATAITSGKTEVDNLKSSIDSLDNKTVTVTTVMKEVVQKVVQKVSNAGKQRLSERFGIGGVNGTAHVNGTAFKQGDWGTKNSGTALVGELGREVLIRDGKYFTVGDYGAEFIKYKKGDIILNHIQSKQLFENGKVTADNGRAKAFVGGTAFSQGTAFAEGTNSFDWLEVSLSRLERTIDNLDKAVNNVYDSWENRDNALDKEMGELRNLVNSEMKAAQQYFNEASAVGLNEFASSKGDNTDYEKLVRDGGIDVNDVTNEQIAKKIQEYQSLYEKALACQDAAEKFTKAQAELASQKFDNLIAQYDGILQGFEHTGSMIDEYINQAEVKGHIVSKNYYKALIENEKQNISTLKQEQSALIAARDEAVEKGTITAYSQEWYDMCSEIDGVTLAIEKSNTALIEYGNSMRDIDWQVFDLIQERISDVTKESDFLIDLMSNSKLFDDNGKLTDNGMATMGLHAQNVNTYMYQADTYADEIKKLDKQIASLDEKGDYDENLNERRRELIELQRESILAAEDEKQAIKDLVSEGIEKELDALQERIDLHNEELNSMKDLYEYQKNVQKQSEEIATLEKQRAAYLNDTSESGRAKLQEITISLKEAKESLEETEFDRYISQQEELLSSLYDEYELVLNERLDNLDGLITESFATVNDNAEKINTTISGVAEDVGVELSNELTDIWSGENGIEGVVREYGDGFSKSLSSVVTTLGDIKSGVNSLAGKSDKDAKENIKQPKTTTSAKKNPTGSSSNNSKPTSSSSGGNKSTGDGNAKVGDKVKFLSGKYYYDSQGKNPAGSKYQGKQVYITNVNKKSWATHPYHISTGKKLGSGDLGWLKLNQISGYADGKKNFLNDEITWTQENGKEFIVRPSDGAILTPVAKGDSVLTSAASNNIWNMANSPAEFIKDNLNFGATNVPNNSNTQNNCVQNFDKVVFNLPNVKNYEQLLSEMQKDKNFERLILSMSIDRLAGKSSLAKGKSIR